MNQPKLARDIMVTKLVTLSPDMDALEAIGLLLKHKISGAPVVDSNRHLVGVFSEKCCMNLIVKAAYDQVPSNKIDPFIDHSPATVTEETDLLGVAQQFIQTGARRLPVLRDHELVGQISRRDLLRVTYDLMKVAPDQGSSLLYLSSLFDRADPPIR